MDSEIAGVRDEIGFLHIHQRYADMFFPGTSVLHTRLRYALFVPWHFQDVAALGGGGPERDLKERERRLAGRLRGQGVIGRRKYPNPSNQPPSVVYWSALSTWGILAPDRTGRTPSRSRVHTLLRNRSRSVDDDKNPLDETDEPFTALPDPPGNWNEGEIDFDLLPAEAEFLRLRLRAVQHEGAPSLLSLLVRHGKRPPVDMYSERIIRIAGRYVAPLRRAQQAASLAGIGRAAYAALVETLQEERDRIAASTRHRESLAGLLEDHRSPALDLDVEALASDLGTLPLPLREVVLATQAWLRSRRMDLRNLIPPYAEAERRKKTRSRLADTRDGRERRREWRGDEHPLGEPLHYRWNQVRWLLNDLAKAS